MIFPFLSKIKPLGAGIDVALILLLLARSVYKSLSKICSWKNLYNSNECKNIVNPRRNLNLIFGTELGDLSTSSILNWKEKLNDKKEHHCISKCKYKFK